MVIASQMWHGANIVEIKLSEAWCLYQVSRADPNPMATDHREDWSPWLARAARAVRKDPRVGEIKWVPYNDYSLPPVAEQVVEQVVVAEQVGVAEAAVAAKYTQRCRGYVGRPSYDPECLRSRRRRAAHHPGRRRACPQGRQACRKSGGRLPQSIDDREGSSLRTDSLPPYL